MLIYITRFLPCPAPASGPTRRHAEISSSAFRCPGICRASCLITADLFLGMQNSIYSPHLSHTTTPSPSLPTPRLLPSCSWPFGKKLWQCPSKRGVGNEHRVDWCCLWRMLLQVLGSHFQMETRRDGYQSITWWGENAGSVARGSSLYGEAFPCF